jgi:dienelactone hydrolase
MNSNNISQDPISKYRKADGTVPPDFDQPAWRHKHFSFATENVPKWFEAVREQFGKADTRYACVGYCFGAPFVCSLLAGDLVSAGAFAHPSLLKEEHFNSIRRKFGYSLETIHRIRWLKQIHRSPVSLLC